MAHLDTDVPPTTTDSGEEVSEQADQARLARIEKYCKTRSYYKGRLTVFNNFLQYGDVKQISARLENLKTIYADFMRIQSKLDACYPQGEPGNERKDFEERYYALVTKATKKIKIFKRQRASLSSLNQAGPSGGQALGSVKEQKMQLMARPYLSLVPLYVIQIHFV